MDRLKLFTLKNMYRAKSKKIRPSRNKHRKSSPMGGSPNTPAPTRRVARGKPSKRKILIVLVALLVVALGGASALSYIKWRDAERRLESFNDPAQYEKLQMERAQATIDALGKLMILPDEKPTIATIVDVESLKKQNPEFYKNARNDDKILVYPNKAIIYRESENIIVNVLPVVTVPRNNTAQGLQVEVIDGTDRGDAFNTVKDRIAKLANGQVVDGGKADTTYDKTVVYDISDGKKTEQIKKLASDLGYEYSDSIPAGIASQADTVVILGNDIF